MSRILKFLAKKNRFYFVVAFDSMFLDPASQQPASERSENSVRFSIFIKEPSFGSLLIPPELKSQQSKNKKIIPLLVSNNDISK